MSRHKSWSDTRCDLWVCLKKLTNKKRYTTRLQCIAMVGHLLDRRSPAIYIIIHYIVSRDVIDVNDVVTSLTAWRPQKYKAARATTIANCTLLEAVDRRCFILIKTRPEELSVIKFALARTSSTGQSDSIKLLPTYDPDWLEIAAHSWAEQSWVGGGRAM